MTESVTLPGFHDHHLHLLAMAASRLSVDCSAAASIEDVVSLIADRHAATPPGRWIRAAGYDDAFLAERRHPSRGDLDRAAPGRAVVLHHRTGHVAVASSAALAALGRASSPDGVLVDEHELLARVPRLGRAEMRAALGEASLELASRGVVAVTDATVTNGPEEFEFLSLLAGDGTIRQRVGVMAGAARVGEFVDAGLRYGAEQGRVRVGHAKVFAEEGDDVSDVVAQAHALGFPVAVHVLDVGPLDHVLDILERSQPPAGTADRLEHCALCLPEQVARIAAAGAVVVSNPGFIEHRGAKYLEELSDVERGWLYRIGSLSRAGVRVQAGSDAPVTPSDPLQMVRSAVGRRYDDEVIGPEERLSLRDALTLVTSPRPGDLVELDADPVCLDDPGAARVLRTMCGGVTIFQAPLD